MSLKRTNTCISNTCKSITCTAYYKQKKTLYIDFPTLTNHANYDIFQRGSLFVVDYRQHSSYNDEHSKIPINYVIKV